MKPTRSVPALKLLSPGAVWARHCLEINHKQITGSSGQGVILSGGKKTQHCEVRGGVGGARHSGSRPGRSGWAAPKAVAVPGCFASLGLEPLQEQDQSLCWRAAKPSSGYSWEGGWDTRTCATARARQCLQCVPARPCARGRLEGPLRDQGRHQQNHRFRSADPAAASGTRASGTQGPSLPTELAVPRPRGPRAASWPQETQTGLPGPGAALGIALGSRVPLWPGSSPEASFPEAKVASEPGRGWGLRGQGMGGRSHFWRLSPATLPGCGRAAGDLQRWKAS